MFYIVIYLFIYLFILATNFQIKVKIRVPKGEQPRTDLPHKSVMEYGFNMWNVYFEQDQVRPIFCVYSIIYVTEGNIMYLTDGC